MPLRVRIVGGRVLNEDRSLYSENSVTVARVGRQTCGLLSSGIIFRNSDPKAWFEVQIHHATLILVPSPGTFFLCHILEIKGLLLYILQTIASSWLSQRQMCL